MPGSEQHYRFEWRFDAPPVELWREVSNTERFNKVIGLPEPAFVDTPHEDGGSVRHGTARTLGLPLRWREHPYQWVAPRVQSVLREFDRGPLRTLRSQVQLTEQEGGGTHLVHQLWLTPSTPLAAPLVKFEAAVKTRRAMDRAYRRMDEKVRARLASPVQSLADDAFEEPRNRLEPAARARFEGVMQRLRKSRRADAAIAQRLGELVSEGADHAVERLRTRILARRWSVDHERLLETCLVAVHAGLLSLSWQLLCPLCRMSAHAVESLADLAPSVHCGACNIDFGAGFDRGVELVFQPNPAIRSVRHHTYCLGSPARAVHVVAQQWLLPGDARTLSVPLSPGRYRLHGPRFGPLLEVVATESSDDPASLEVVVDAHRGAAASAPRVAAGEVELHLVNRSDTTQTVRLDWAAWTQDAVTAAEATTRAVFRDLFAAEVVAPGLDVDVGRVAIVFTDLRGSTSLYEAEGDGEAYALVREHFDILGEVLAVHRGALVKTIGDAIMAAFVDPGDALLAALSFQGALQQSPQTAGLAIKCGLHYGSAIGANANGRLDYFGTAVNLAARLERVAGPGEVALSAETLEDPAVRRMLVAHPELLKSSKEIQLKGLSEARRVVVLGAPGGQVLDAGDDLPSSEVA